MQNPFDIQCEKILKDWREEETALFDAIKIKLSALRSSHKELATADTVIYIGSKEEALLLRANGLNRITDDSRLFGCKVIVVRKHSYLSVAKI